LRPEEEVVGKRYPEVWILEMGQGREEIGVPWIFEHTRKEAPEMK
jgi:hypothetical protein